MRQTRLNSDEDEDDEDNERDGDYKVEDDGRRWTCAD